MKKVEHLPDKEPDVFVFQDLFEIKTELKESDYCTSIHQVSCHLSKVAVAGFLTFVLIFRTAIRPPNVKTPSTIASNQPAGIQTRPTALSLGYNTNDNVRI